MKPYRLIALALAALLALTCVGWAEGNACPPVETGIRGHLEARQSACTHLRQGADGAGL